MGEHEGSPESVADKFITAGDNPAAIDSVLLGLLLNTDVPV